MTTDIIDGSGAVRWTTNNRWTLPTVDRGHSDNLPVTLVREKLLLRTAAPMPKPRDFNAQPKLWHPCCLVTVDCGAVHNKMHVP
jgi:hypothetical protein